MHRYLLLLSPLVLFIFACDPTSMGADDDESTDNFDRQEMLTGWADFIEANAAAYDASLTDLRTSAQQFQSSPTEANHALLRADFDKAYTIWQNYDVVLIGKAEEIRLRERSNTYPANVSLIEDNIADGDANLALPSMNDAQGFPALDYLIYELDQETLGQQKHSAYLVSLIVELEALRKIAADDFTLNRTAYITNDGNSATASIDRTVNDYIFYYEKFLRAGKVGIPAGVFSDDPLADRAESRYGQNSRQLLLTALQQTKNFFANEGLRDYLDALDVRRDGELLSAQIIGQFNTILSETNNVGEDLGAQVVNDNAKMLALYDEMQRLVVLLKVDMLQALSINVDYVDADGD